VEPLSKQFRCLWVALTPLAPAPSALAPENLFILCK
jgi:hypothetical protein